MATKTLVSNLEMASMPGNSVKVNSSPNDTQPTDVSLQTGQLLGHAGNGVGAVNLVGTHGIDVTSDSKTNTFTVDGTKLEGVPIGTVMFFAASAAPAGWTECNGEARNRPAFIDLFNVIGYTFGGSGNTFYLPDLRGQFVRGWDHGLGIDSGRTFGSKQNDQLQKFDLSAETGVVPGSATDVVMQLENGRGYNTGSTGGNGVFTDGSAWKTSPSSYTKVTPVNANVGSETRPTNVALLPCIKYTTATSLNTLGVDAQRLIDLINALEATKGITGVKNTLINGDMRIDQRKCGGAFVVPQSTNGNRTYYGSCDRWCFQSDNSTMTVQQINGVRLGTSYALQMTGAAGNSMAYLFQRIESLDCCGLVGQTVTLSFKAASNVNINTSVAATYAQAPDAYTTNGGVSFFTQSYTVTDTPKTFSFTFVIPSGGINGLEILPFRGILAANQSIYISNIQLEIGSLPTPFENRPYSTELMSCQRYFETSYGRNQAPGTPNASTSAWTYANSSSLYYNIYVTYKVTKRINASIKWYDPVTGAAQSIHSSTQHSYPDGTTYPQDLEGDSQSGFSLQLNFNGGAQDYYIHWTADSEI